jgi:hypothetical protein
MAVLDRSGGIAMAGPDKIEVDFSNLSLEPLPDPHAMHYEPPKAKLAASPAASAPTAAPRPSKSTDRRVGKERRQTLRFEADRRSGKDRRPRKGFDEIIGKIE